MAIEYSTCPHCKAEMTFEEIKQQECWSCGWPGSHKDDDMRGAFDTDRVDSTAQIVPIIPRFEGGLGHIKGIINREEIKAQIAAEAEYRQLLNNTNPN